MRKLIASMNMTLDGYCDHTSVSPPDDELMAHYNEQMRNTGALIYGRKTYQLMEDYWPLLVKSPGEDKLDNEFAVLMDDVTKVVFSKTLKSVVWKNSILAQGELNEEVLKLKRQPGKDLYVGSPSLIAQLMQAGLIDEYRLCIHPVVAGSGLVLFKGIENKIGLRLVNAKTFKSGVVALFYERLNNDKK
jgi:dihydrofolate reductase